MLSSNSELGSSAVTPIVLTVRFIVDDDAVDAIINRKSSLVHPYTMALRKPCKGTVTDCNKVNKGAGNECDSTHKKIMVEESRETSYVIKMLSV